MKIWKFRQKPPHTRVRRVRKAEKARVTVDQRGEAQSRAPVVVELQYSATELRYEQRMRERNGGRIEQVT